MPKLDLDLTPKRPKLDLPKLDLPKSDLPSFPSLRPFSEDGFSFGQVSRPPLKRKDPKFAYVDTKPLKVPEEKPEDLYNLEKRPFRPEPQPEVELTRPKRRKPASPTAFQSSPFNPEFNFGNGPEFPEPQSEVELTRPKRRRPASAFESEPFKPEFNFGNVPEFPDLTQTVQRPGRQVFNRFEESARPNFNRFEEQSRPEFNRIESSRPEFGRPGFEETPRQILNSQRPGFNRFSDSNFPELSRFEESAKRFRNSARAPEFEEASRPGPPYVEDLDFNQVEKPQTRLKRKFPFKERSKTLTERPSRVRKRFPDERLKFRGLPARSYFEDRNSVGTGVYRTTTPRPIPTPGPNDFPRPPPHLLRPRPPPTHPTHPPLVTHPPEHYETVTRLPPSLNEIPQTKLTEITEYDDDDTFDDNQDEGFFAYPGSFPSLADLGAGFESMKIRRRSGRSTRAKRSLDERDPLMTSEARRRRRIRRPGNRRGIVDNRRLVKQWYPDSGPPIRLLIFLGTAEIKPIKTVKAKDSDSKKLSGTTSQMTNFSTTFKITTEIQTDRETTMPHLTMRPVDLTTRQAVDLITTVNVTAIPTQNKPFKLFPLTTMTITILTIPTRDTNVVPLITKF